MNEEFFLKTVSSGGDKRSGGVRERQGPGVNIGAAREHVVEIRGKKRADEHSHRGLRVLRAQKYQQPTALRQDFHWPSRYGLDGLTLNVSYWQGRQRLDK